MPYETLLEVLATCDCVDQSGRHLALWLGSVFITTLACSGILWVCIGAILGSTVDPRVSARTVHSISKIPHQLISATGNAT
jgi:hypothetical protein